MFKKFRLRFLILVFFTTIILCGKSQSITQIDYNYFSAGIPTIEFEYFAAPNDLGKQRSENWCWAACIQMVLNYHGLYISQEELVYKIFGDIVDSPADQNMILYALNGWNYNYFGGMWYVYAEPGVYNCADIVTNLAYKWPLIVGLNNPDMGVGHAYVLTAIEYSVDAFNNPIPYKVILRDPWPGNPSRQELAWDEFVTRINTIVKIWVIR